MNAARHLVINARRVSSPAKKGQLRNSASPIGPAPGQQAGGHSGAGRRGVTAHGGPATGRPLRRRRAARRGSGHSKREANGERSHAGRANLALAVVRLRVRQSVGECGTRLRLRVRRFYADPGVVRPTGGGCRTKGRRCRTDRTRNEGRGKVTRPGHRSRAPGGVRPKNARVQSRGLALAVGPAANRVSAGGGGGRRAGRCFGLAHRLNDPEQLKDGAIQARVVPPMPQPAPLGGRQAGAGCAGGGSAAAMSSSRRRAYAGQAPPQTARKAGGQPAVPCRSTRSNSASRVLGRAAAVGEAGGGLFEGLETPPEAAEHASLLPSLQARAPPTRRSRPVGRRVRESHGQRAEAGRRGHPVPQQA